MPFIKGQSKPVNSGNKKGQKSAKVQAWEELGEYFTNAGARKYFEYISQLEAEEFAKRYEAMLEYFKPKLQRSENRVEVASPEDRSVRISIAGEDMDLGE